MLGGVLGGVLGGEPRRAPRARRRGGELCISSCGSGGGAVAPARRQTLADDPAVYVHIHMPRCELVVLSPSTATLVSG